MPIVETLADISASMSEMPFSSSSISHITLTSLSYFSSVTADKESIADRKKYEQTRINSRNKKSSESEGFITASQFARFIGVSNVSQCKYKYLSGLERVDGKYYFIPDVANVLMSRVDSTG